MTDHKKALVPDGELVSDDDFREFNADTVEHIRKTDPDAPMDLIEELSAMFKFRTIPRGGGGGK